MIPLAVFAVAFIATLLLTPLVTRMALRYHAIDVPQPPRRLHRRPTPRWGGIALAAGFLLAAGFIYWLHATGRMPPPRDPNDWRRLRGVLLGGIAATLFGAYDDLRELSPLPQLVAQLVLAFIAIAHIVFLERFTNPLTDKVVVLPSWLTVLVTVFWVVGMINTVNWLDGLDGLAAGVTAIAALLFAIHSYVRIGQLTVGLFPIALVGACLGFLPWNFYPARIFMGTAGSMFLGYNLAAFSLIAPAKVATALLVLGIPILDVAWQIAMRVWHGRAPWLADRGHLHHRLYDLGVSQRQVVLLYYLFCAVFGTMALVLTHRLYKLVALGVLGTLVLAVLVLLTRQAPADRSVER